MVSEGLYVKKALGVVAATITAPVALAAFVIVDNFLQPLLSFGWIPAATWGTVWSTIEFQASIAIPIASVVSLLGGIPLGNRLVARGRTRPLNFVVLGAILGSVPLLLFEVPQIAGGIVQVFRHMTGNGTGEIASKTRVPVFGMRFALHWLIVGAWCGAWSALAYWVVVYRGSPSNYAFQRTHSRVTPRAEHASRHAARR